MMISPIMLHDMVRNALAEDLGHGQDITSAATIPANTTATAVFRARESGIVAGIFFAQKAFDIIDPTLKFNINITDGQNVTAGDTIATVTGNARSIMIAERVALNYMTHLSGIATLTSHYVAEATGTTAKIADTRKTLPHLRAAQKYAVKMGGGVNHRFGLDDAILIKDNHIAIAGGIHAALTAAQNYAGHTVKIEIEVDTLAQLDEVLQHGGADIVMLDNFAHNDLATAVATINGALITEASGGVTLKTVRNIAATGVDYISVGALTHSAPVFDIGLDIDAD